MTKEQYTTLRIKLLEKEIQKITFEKNTPKATKKLLVEYIQTNIKNLKNQ